MATSNQQQNAGNSSDNEQKGQFQNLNEVDSENRKATEQRLREIFTRHKELPEASNEDLTKEVSRAFQLFRSDFSDFLGPKRDNDKEKKIRERISNLQKRTTETLQVLANCKENVGSVVFLDTKEEQSAEFGSYFISFKIKNTVPQKKITFSELPKLPKVDRAFVGVIAQDESTISETRSLGELTEKLKEIQIGVPSNSDTTIERPDIEDMKNATDRLRDELGRISKSYASEKNSKSSSWLSKATGKRQ